MFTPALRRLQMRSRSQAGFTLIELLVVIIILGILAAVVVFAVGGVGDKGQSAADEIDERTLRTAEEAFFSRNGRYGTEAELVAGGFLSEESSTHQVDVTDEGPSGEPGSAYVIYVPRPDTALLRVGGPPDTYRLTPANRASVTTFAAHGSVIETLAIPAPDLTLRPLLATSWTFTAPATWDINLRSGVTFHNGAAFDAAAVAGTLNQRLVGTVRGLTVGGTTVTGPSSIQVVTNPPNSQLMRQLSHPNNGIPAPGTYPGAGAGVVDGTYGIDTPTGTGPYKFVSYTPMVELNVTRNDAYWEAAPTFTDVNYKFMTDGTARVQALRAGEVDAIYDVPRSQVDSLSSDRIFGVHKSITGAHQSLYLNFKGVNPAFTRLTERPVRQAIAHALDTNSIVTNVWPGGAEVLRTLLPASLLGPDAANITGYDFNQDAARSLLEGVGWVVPVGSTDGIRMRGADRLELKMQVYLPDEQQPLPELVKSQLAEVGIQVNINVPATASAYFGTVGAGDGDIFSEGSASGAEHPLGPGSFFRTSAASYGLYMSPGPDYDLLHDEAFAAIDDTVFKQKSAAAMDILVDRDIVVVPIAGVFRIYGVHRGLEGFEPYTFIYSQRWHTLTPRS
ncbi:MAG: ABC transporter substrate-binding protein [Acidimicrobiales bacterium]